MSVTAKPVRVVLLDRTAPILNAPEHVWLTAVVGCGVIASVLFHVGHRLKHHR